MHDQETPEQRAIRLLTVQLNEIGTHICALNDSHPDFKAWRDTTRGYLERFLGKDNHHATRFRGTRFYGPSYMRSDFPGVPQGPSQREIQEKVQAFQNGCETARATLQAAIKEIQEFGLYTEQPKPVSARRGRGGNGGVHQTFHAPVTMNQAIATDNAMQRVDHLGDEVGPSLGEIGELLKESDSISARQLSEVLKGIEVLTAETRKPAKKRDWKSIFTYGQLVLDVAGKAADVAHKLAPYTPAIVALLESGKQFL
ncbi:MAG TPA: hypothetical protein VGS27_32000 [Candidatus Sulfotelmatobacter sp.]|nr:hypothetical protein [Candidatus Sulfotelmatobacter sp.]